MRRLALAFAPALIAGSIATARATPPAPVAAPAPPPPAVQTATTPSAAQESALNPGSSVVLRTFRSASLKRDWSYTVYLPPGYNPEGARYPVMYLLHGNAGNANDWVTQGRLQATADTLIERREIPPVVIVMPQGGTDWYVDRKEKMQSAFLNDLLPEVEAHFAVSNQRAGRAIGGVSMGGFGALRFSCHTRGSNWRSPNTPT